MVKTDKPGNSSSGRRWGTFLRAFAMVGAGMLFAADEYMESHKAHFVKFLGEETMVWMGLILAVSIAGLIYLRTFLDTSAGKKDEADTIEQTPSGPAVRTTEASGEGEEGVTHNVLTESGETA